jgi:radical SAM superfamily enzyme YgiQ (UPF0313 family)
MKILLISLSSSIYSVGLRSISACLKQEGHDVHLLFLTKEFTEQYNETALHHIVKLAEGKKLIGISLMTNFFDHAVQVTRTIKKSCNTKIIWGGVHPTVCPEECLEYADIVCRGEGEDAIVELANRMDKGDIFAHDIDNMCFKGKSGENVFNRIRPYLKSLDDLPFQDYDYKSHSILTDDGSLQQVDSVLMMKYLKGTYMTMPSRGCPFSCTYCCNNSFNKLYSQQKPLRRRTMNNVIDELIKVKAEFPTIKRVLFEDDAFLCYPRNDIEFFSRKYKKHIGLPLAVTGAAPLTVDKEKLSLLVEAGLTLLRMGIQTGSESTRKLYGRKEKNQQIKEAAKIINEFKCNITRPNYDIILDNPWETDKELIETLRLLSELPVPYKLNLFSLNFYPGTDLYRKAKNDGIINDDIEDIYRKHFRNIKNTYLNNLFVMLNNYAFVGICIPPHIMFFLTDQDRNFYLRRLLYCTLFFLSKYVRYLGLIRKGWQDIREGDLSRIRSYLTRKKTISV